LKEEKRPAKDRLAAVTRSREEGGCIHRAFAGYAK
jgi:hypothetical protein